MLTLVPVPTIKVKVQATSSQNNNIRSCLVNRLNPTMSVFLTWLVYAHCYLMSFILSGSFIMDHLTILHPVEIFYLILVLLACRMSLMFLISYSISSLCLKKPSNYHVLSSSSLIFVYFRGSTMARSWRLVEKRMVYTSYRRSSLQLQILQVSSVMLKEFFGTLY